MSVVVSGDFFRFRLALPSLLFLPIEEVAAAHSDFDHCPRGGDLRTENPPDRHFLSHILRSKIISPWDMSQYQNSPRISLETSVFFLNFQVRFALNKQTGHGRGKNLGTRSIFSLPSVVGAINVPYLPHPHRDTRRYGWEKCWEKCRLGRFSARKPPPRGQWSKSECAALTPFAQSDWRRRRGRELEGLKRLSLLFPPGQFCVKNNFAWNSVNRKTLPRKELN